MPGGWKMAQMHAEQPATTYAEFKREILNEIARCLNMPFNVAAGNSSGYNYASGRLDHQTYFKSIRVEQSQMARTVLDRILYAWLREAILIEGYLPNSLRTLDSSFEHQWFWDGHEHVDPAKEANAQKIRLANHTTTLAHEYARQGRDWEAELKQRAKEISLMRELGLSTDSTSLSPGEVTDDEDIAVEQASKSEVDAESVPSSLRIVCDDASSINLQAAEAAEEGKPALRKFSMVAYTGGAMRLGGWPYPVVVDLAGMRVTRKSRPILKDHDRGSIVGHTDDIMVSDSADWKSPA